MFIFVRAKKHHKYEGNIKIKLVCIGGLPVLFH